MAKKLRSQLESGKMKYKDCNDGGLIMEKEKKDRLLEMFKEWLLSDLEELDLLRIFIITHNLEEDFDKWVSDRKALLYVKGE